MKPMYLDILRDFFKTLPRKRVSRCGKPARQDIKKVKPMPLEHANALADVGTIEPQAVVPQHSVAWVPLAILT